MTDRAVLLHAVVADPSDDLVRLVFADWLDDHDEPDRAEFIRTQIRLSQMEPWDDGYTALDIRSRELERANPEWFSIPDKFTSDVEHFCGQRQGPLGRGFLARIRLPPAQFAKQAALFADNPITCVTFDLGGRVGSSWFKQPALAQLPGAEFAYIKDPARLVDVRRCLDRLPPLDHFGLVGCPVDGLDAQETFATQTVAGVRSLCIMGTRLSAAAEAALASAAWPNLRRLSRVRVFDLDWLRAPWIGPLRELTISDSGPNLTPTARRGLADVLPDTDLRRLELGWWELDEVGGRELGQAVARSPVKSFALHTHNRASVIRALLTLATLAGLHALYLSWAELDAEVVGRLAGTELRVCALNHMTADALSGLTNQPGLPELTELRLGLVKNGTDDPLPSRLRAVLEAGTLPQLTSLTVCETTPGFTRSPSLGDPLATTIADCPAAATLRFLQLGEVVTRCGVEALVSSPHLANLRLLNARVWPKDAEAERILVERFGTGAYLDIVNRTF